MSRYVDADELKDAWVTYGSLEVMEMLLDGTFPTIEIVRCKECSRQLICYHSDNYFCADGEKVTE